jgi:uncharacterized membrane protein
MQIDPKKNEGQENKTNKNALYLMLFETGLEFALIIAIPLILLIYAGKWADSKLRTHFFVVIGILLAISCSSYLIYKKIKEIRKLLK